MGSGCAASDSCWHFVGCFYPGDRKSITGQLLHHEIKCQVPPEGYVTSLWDEYAAAYLWGTLLLDLHWKKKKEQKPTVQHFNNIFYLEKVLKSQDSHDGQRFLGETAFPCCPQAVPAALHFPSTTSPQSLLCLKEHSSLPSTALDLSMAFGVCFTCSEGRSLAGAGLLRSVTAAQPLTAVSPVLHCCKLPPIETNSASSN